MDTLDFFFQWLLAASLRASLLALAVLILQLVLRRCLPARWRHALWLPVVVVLIAPVLPASRWSLQNRIASPLVVRAALLPAETGRPDTGMVPETEMQTDSAASVATRSRAHRTMLVAWLAGACSFLGAGAIGYRRNMRHIKRGALETDAPLAESVARVARELKLRRTPRVVVSAAIGSPAVAGFFRPMLLLPAGFSGDFSDAEKRLILLHELMHLKRCDLPLNWLLCVLQGLHWFNPLLWLAFARMRSDREMACDAQVLASDAEDRRADYGHALLRLQNSVPCPGRSLAFVGIFERSAGMRSRIRAVAGFRRAHGAWGLVVAMGIALLTALGATRAAHAKAPSQPAPVLPKAVADTGSKPTRAAGSNVTQIEIEANFIEVPEAVWKQMAAAGPWEVVRGQREWSRLVTSTERKDQESLVESWFGKEVTADSGGFLPLVAKALSEKNGVDLLSTPKVTTRSNQKAIIEIIREFKYATAWKPGEKKEDAWVPTNYETRNTGVTLDVVPKLTNDGEISLWLTPQVVEFEGFNDIGHGRKQPIFTERKVRANVTLRSGQTVILGGALREDQQMVENKIPVLGDIPFLGRLFRSSQMLVVKRCLVVVVTPRILPKE